MRRRVCSYVPLAALVLWPSFGRADSTRPAVDKPAIATPAIATPAIAPPAIATPAIAPPAIATPAIATPAIAPPAIAPPAIAPPAIAPPAIAPPATTAPVTTLGQAYAVLASHPKVDLTHAFGPTTPVWSGFGQAKMTPAVKPDTLEAYTIARDGFRATYYAMVGQYGTHVDPPAHFAPTGATMDEIKLDEMILPLVVLDDTQYLAADPAHAFSLDDLAAWEKLHGRVPKGTFVALRTDMARDWDNPARFKREPFPGWSLPVVKRLFEERGVVAIGHESMDTDATKTMDSEKYVLDHGHYQIEVMDNLDKVPPTGAIVIATWPKVKNGLGFPARVFAILP